MASVYPELALYIDGTWLRDTTGGTRAVTDPATDAVLGHLPLAGGTELDAALAAAARGFDVWRKTPPIARQAIMETAARDLEAGRDGLAAILTAEMGKPLTEARAEIDFMIGILRWYGEEGKRAYGRVIPARQAGLQQIVLREPVGPVAAFVAWNFPAVNVIRKVAGALAAGCSIIIKASEETPAICLEIVAAFARAGLPAGVLNAVFGDPDAVSRHLLASPVTRKLSFTGSVPVGIHLQKLAAETLMHSTMELGGHAPALIFADADIEGAVLAVAAQKFRNAGQICTAIGRVYVEDSIYPRVVEAMGDIAHDLVVGAGDDPATQMGPLVAHRRLAVMEDFVQDALTHGARLVAGGARIGNVGAFFAPTVLADVPDHARLMREEVFGPVMPMRAFHSEEEVITAANSLDFGLAAYAFTRDAGRAQRLSQGIAAGMLGINSTLITTPETPFGGIHASGFGSEGGVEGLEAYQHARLVTQMTV